MDQRQICDVEGFHHVLLPQVDVQHLACVALVEEQAHAHQGYAQVRCRLQVIPGQDAQAAGIDGKRFVDAEFHAEVGDGRERMPLRGEPPGGDGVGTPELSKRAIHPGRYIVCRPLLDPFGFDLLEHGYRVLVGLLVKIHIEIPEDRPHLGFPGPPQVLGELLQFWDELIHGGPSEAARVRAVLVSERRPRAAAG